MKKRYNFLLLLLITGLLAGCGSTGKPQPVQTIPEGVKAEEEQKSMFLWKLEKGNSVLFFLGSIHMATEDIYPLHDRIYQAFAESEILVVELDNTNTDNLMATQQLTMAKGIFPENESIVDYVSDELLQQLENMAIKYGIPPAVGMKFMPWVIEITIAALEMQKLGYNYELGLDMHFLKKAQEEGKEIRELETVAEQIGLISDIPIQEQVLSLKSTIAEIEMIPNYLNDLVTAWRNGADEKFYTLTMQSYVEYPEFMDVYNRLFIERNRKWVRQFEEMIDAGGRYFIITGAGHMAGKGSVIDLLRQKGYQLIQY